MSDEVIDYVAMILQADSTIQHLLRINWPESWLRINLPFGSTRALLAIEAFNARTPSAVADVLDISRTTVTGLLDRLEAEGLLTRAIDPADRRSIALHVTDKGTNLLRQIESFRHEQLNRALLAMNSDALAALDSGLQALTEALRRTVIAPDIEQKEHEKESQVL